MLTPQQGQGLGAQAWAGPGCAVMQGGVRGNGERGRAGPRCMVMRDGRVLARGPRRQTRTMIGLRFNSSAALTWAQGLPWRADCQLQAVRDPPRADVYELGLLFVCRQSMHLGCIWSMVAAAAGRTGWAAAGGGAGAGNNQTTRKLLQIQTSSAVHTHLCLAGGSTTACQDFDRFIKLHF